MIELKAQAALDEAPVAHGDVRLAVADPGPITAVMPLGDGRACARALKAAHGVTFPAPGVCRTGKRGARIAWSGARQAFLIGAEPGEIEGAALADQTDAWVCLSLTGGGAEEVLARLVPLDLAALGDRGCARSLLGQMPLLLIREAEGYLLLTFRSMAGTAWREITHAMRAVAARRGVR